MKNGTLSSLPWVLVCMLGSTSALAQEETESGAEASAEARAEGEVGLGLPGATPAATTTAAATIDPPPGRGDHDAVVGHAGVGYLGVASVGVGSSDAGAILREVAAPVIGVRYWLNPGMGLDLGLGFGLEGSSTDVGDEEGDGPSFWALVLHGGVPLALSSGRHYVFEIIPEANLGFGSGSTGDTVDHSGFLLDIGARAGAELHFGFIGVPELSLQASVGARYSLQSYSTTTETAGADVEVSSSQYSLRTAVYNSPWSIFTSSVAAFYYF